MRMLRGFVDYSCIDSVEVVRETDVVPELVRPSKEMGGGFSSCSLLSTGNAMRVVRTLNVNVTN